MRHHPLFRITADKTKMIEIHFTSTSPDPLTDLKENFPTEQLLAFTRYFLSCCPNMKSLYTL